MKDINFFPDSIKTAIDVRDYSPYYSHSRVELFDYGYNLSENTRKKRDNLYKFYDQYPGSGVPYPEDMGYTIADISLYYERMVARYVYIEACEKEFDIFKIDESISSKIRISGCKHPLLWVLGFITILWNLLILWVSVETNMGFLTTLLVIFGGSISVAGGLFLITIITLSLVSLIYNFTIHYRFEKANNLFYKSDKLSQVLSSIYSEQYKYLENTLSATLPRIEYQENIPTRLPKDTIDVEIAKSIIAKRNTKIYHEGVYLLSSEEHIIRKLISVDDNYTSVLDAANISIELWQKIALDIFHIGMIRGISRVSGDYRWKIDKGEREDGLKWTMKRSHINRALNYFGISIEAWVELGEDTLNIYNIYERDYLKSLGFLLKDIPLRADYLHLL